MKILNRLKRISLSALILLAGIVISIPVNDVQAKSKSKTSESAGGYRIQSYDVDIVVNEENVFDITETIDVYFTEARHGIYRKIPLYNEVTRNDGTKSKNRARITDVRCSDEFTTSNESGYYQLKIGDAERTLTGSKEYTIKYSYNIGKDPLENKDEFYFNIIGPEWDVPMSIVRFNIEMPKEFDEEKLGFSTGFAGSTENDNVHYVVEDNEISGYVFALGAGESVTVRLELPEGYFTGENLEPSSTYYLFYGISLIGLIIAFVFWSKYGVDRKVFVKPEYNPPKDLNSLEVGFIYKGSASNKDVISLLIYLANKGYLTIEESEKKGLLSKKKDFKITKVKDYDGTNEQEKTFLKGLFKSGNTVTSTDLYDEFYKTTNKIISDASSSEVKGKIFEKTSGKTAIIVLFAVVSYILAVIPPFVDYQNYEDMIFALIFPGFGLFAIMIALTRIKRLGAAAIFLIIWGLGFGVIPFLALVLQELLIHPLYINGFLFSLVCIIGMSIFISIMPKRTEYGAQKYAEIVGFKDFLKSVEKPRIELMVSENPNFFYDVLPYAYVLGVSDKWIKKFETINLQAPDWYSGTSTFNAITFGSFMNSTMSTATSSMSSSSSSSGGGSSGGGSGGGGGGSW